MPHISFSLSLQFMIMVSSEPDVYELTLLWSTGNKAQGISVPSIMGVCLSTKTKTGIYIFRFFFFTFVLAPY